MQMIKTVNRAFAGMRTNVFAAVAAAALAGCSAGSTVSHSTTNVALEVAPRAAVLDVCSGYGCIYKDRLGLTETDATELAGIMKPGAVSPAAERNAVALAIAKMEQIALGRLPHQRDIKKAYLVNSGKRGQMDCVDESLNTGAYLRYLHDLGLLKHHTPDRRYAERGFLLDGRYPHKSATMRDRSGTRWTVDSWYEDSGRLPQIMPHSKWRKVRNSRSDYRASGS